MAIDPDRPSVCRPVVRKPFYPTWFHPRYPTVSHATLQIAYLRGMAVKARSSGGMMRTEEHSQPGKGMGACAWVAMSEVRDAVR